MRLSYGVLREQFATELEQQGFRRVKPGEFNANSGDVFTEQTSTGHVIFQVCRDARLKGRFGEASPGMTISITTSGMNVTTTQVYGSEPQGAKPRPTFMIDHISSHEIAPHDAAQVSRRIKALKHRGITEMALTQA